MGNGGCLLDDPGDGLGRHLLPAVALARPPRAGGGRVARPDDDAERFQVVDETGCDEPDDPDEDAHATGTR